MTNSFMRMYLSLAVIGIFCFSCVTNENPPAKMEASSDSLKLDLSIYVENGEIQSGDSIKLSGYVQNKSLKPITLLWGKSMMKSISAAGWKRKEFQHVTYNGPSIYIVAPGDSSYFGYDNLELFFDSIPVGKSKLVLKYMVYIEGREDPIEVADSVPIFIKEK